MDNCIIDRRYTGQKFCFIHNGINNGYANDGIIRDCTFYPPKDTPLKKLNNVYSFNFILFQNQSFGGSSTMLAPNQWGMRSGDGNGDNLIDNIDKNETFLNKFGLFGYYPGDYNLDGWINFDDFIMQ